MPIGKDGDGLRKRITTHVLRHSGVHDEYPMMARVPGTVADPPAIAITARDQSFLVDRGAIVRHGRMQIGPGKVQLRRLLEWHERCERLRRLGRFAMRVGCWCFFRLAAPFEQQAQSAGPTTGHA
ncbi:hypothetical protein DF121_05055 [Burkholderia stagnalis]|nr:hypothetical protein DF145_02005 [Burkholderia stagnalis]RQY05473.1 hypothetical protein DF121_05055 [Burkholderia stagnalis]RQY22973.1 hypothetical protein DF115_04830 [Burkholderia stagnalis]RQY36009.1 hypothetical protein DF114_05050 [Burkholderia stagnalis]